ncbi:MAG: response regulator transcription factor [Dehalococcoidales bacterium]|jgi:two-component system OmpR family response regulator|nr:response regulator transcription factor [Dehalococcoidales bacterium]MDX9986066.1 response regulator transcription factor [Dehalococcoidales bacterium]NLE89563.1 response regulator transcription factor [Dehalococcoidales bacterium]
MPGETILLVEDDPSLAEVIRYNLVKNGYQVTAVADGFSALEEARSVKPDIVLLDVMLPGLDGFEVCRRLSKDNNAGVIMLTARSEEMDKVLGLELGADDYITKPFSMRELLSRIKAVLRRRQPMVDLDKNAEMPEARIIKRDGIEIDTSRHTVTADGNLVELGPKEFELLVMLASNLGRVFDRQYLLERIWGYEYAGSTRTVDVHVRWLREKIEKDPANPKRIITVRGFGYKYEADEVV